MSDLLSTVVRVLRLDRAVFVEAAEGGPAARFAYPLLIAAFVAVAGMMVFIALQQQADAFDMALFGMMAPPLAWVGCCTVARGIARFVFGGRATGSTTRALALAAAPGIAIAVLGIGLVGLPWGLATTTSALSATTNISTRDAAVALGTGVAVLLAPPALWLAYLFVNMPTC